MDSGFSCYMTYAKEAFTDYISLDKPIPVRPCFAISIIDAPDYLALSDCTFHTGGEQTLVGGLRADGVQQVIIGPPQPITSASATIITTSLLAPAAMGTVLLLFAGLGSTPPTPPFKVKASKGKHQGGVLGSGVRFGADVSMY
ncbi:hypothetical protein VC83_08485 [Pseudogymnoascus destructans]|uniref:Uncharacterized protein n=1 Tax=Pseudogymnoascus destructans TaxID=655981 RepID=A0A176ZYX2_9PEZI|nr:uncharacterized protein VC83_08485 [Pseudogymnoascus destructans]OAF55116.1 hypothetical protein VC83_08485 [Pseudogymnoascus destructans]